MLLLLSELRLFGQVGVGAGVWHAGGGGMCGGEGGCARGGGVRGRKHCWGHVRGCEVLLLSSELRLFGQVGGAGGGVGMGGQEGAGLQTEDRKGG